MKTKFRRIMWKITWSVHYHVLSLEYLCFLTMNKPSLRIDCSARCVILSCFYFYSVHVQQLSHWRRCTVGEPRTPCLLIGVHALKGWEPLTKHMGVMVMEPTGVAGPAACCSHLSYKQFETTLRFSSEFSITFFRFFHCSKYVLAYMTSFLRVCRHAGRRKSL